MATQVQLRRGTAAQNDAFTGAVGEVTVDTDNDTLRVHDGGTAGGTGPGRDALSRRAHADRNRLGAGAVRHRVGVLGVVARPAGAGRGPVGGALA